MKIAQYKAFGGIMFLEADEWHETQAGYIRLTEVEEVEFRPLPLNVTIPKELAVLDEMERALTEKHAKELASIQSKRKDLLALAPPSVVAA